jgi:hypothetical protein
MLVYAGVIVAVVLSALLVFVARKRTVPPAGRPQVHVFGAYSPVLSWARDQIGPSPRTTIAARQAIRSAHLTGSLEILAIGAWALWVGSGRDETTLDGSRNAVALPPARSVDRLRRRGRRSRGCSRPSGEDVRQFILGAVSARGPAVGGPPGQALLAHHRSPGSAFPRRRT